MKGIRSKRGKWRHENWVERKRKRRKRRKGMRINRDEGERRHLEKG